MLSILLAKRCSLPTGETCRISPPIRTHRGHHVACAPHPPPLVDSAPSRTASFPGTIEMLIRAIIHYQIRRVSGVVTVAENIPWEMNWRSQFSWQRPDNSAGMGRCCHTLSPFTCIKKGFLALPERWNKQVHTRESQYNLFSITHVDPGCRASDRWLSGWITDCALEGTMNSGDGK